MMMKHKMGWPAIATLALVGQASHVYGAIMHDVTGWAVHNGASVVTDGGTNSPTFTPADDNLTVLGTFPQVNLANDGDFVTATTTLMLDTRTGATGTNALNTQLRFGVFGGPAGPVVFEDAPHRGIWIEYSNSGGFVREADPAQTDPFIFPIANAGNLDPDAEGDSIQGADIGPVDFELTLTRNGGDLVITGQISGTDSVSGNPFLSVIDPAIVYTPTASGFNFDFNRVGFAFRNNTNAPNGTLSDVIVTTNVPEPSSGMLAAFMAVGGMLVGDRARRAWQGRRGHAPR
jgi:hypothetical protein